MKQAVPTAGLLEREAELGAVAALLDESEGAVVTIEGAAGIGKTELLMAACAMARERGAQVLTARGGELERGYALGVARQLFAPVAAMPEAERNEALEGAAGLAAPLLGLAADREAPSIDPSFADFHGLYWLTVNLAGHRPLVLAVDDAHWADAGSLRWLSYLAKRLDGVPVVLLVAARPHEPDSEVGLLNELSTERLARTLHPEPLSPAAAATLVRDRLGGDADEVFCTACHEVTVGNPFYLRRLLDSLADDGVEPAAARADSVRILGPEAISRSILVRLARLGPDATQLARAVAVLEGAAELGRAAQLAGLSEADAAAAADLLTAVDVLRPTRPLTFVHPVVRAAIYEDIAPRERARRHAEAARILRNERLSPEAAAAHVLQTDPAGAPETVATLREAASVASARGATDAAISYLSRALAEPPPPDARGDVLVELGRTEARAHSLAAAEHLAEALEAESDPIERARIGHELGLAHMMVGRLDEAIAAFDRAIDEVGDRDRDLALRIDVDLIGAARFNPATRPLAKERLARWREELVDDAGGEDGPAERLVLANLALELIFTGPPRETVIDVALRALGGGKLLREVGIDSPVMQLPLWGLCYSDAWEDVERELGIVLAESRRQGSALGFSVASVIDGTVAWRRGDVAAAESAARDSLDSQPDAAIDFPLAAALLVEVNTERGDYDKSQALLEGNGYTGDLPAFPLFTPLMYARARMAIFNGELDKAIADLRECANRIEAFGSRNPTMFPWRTTLALVLARRDELDEARALAADAVELASGFGAKRSSGIAMHGLALVEEDHERLQHAVDLLAESGARLAHAAALVDLGASLRRRGHRRESREPLRQGLEIAYRCGSPMLTARAREELLASGARPRRHVVSGLDSLTASERRVAQMAADGMTNKEIAQALFVTVKTVETHMARIFRKLELSSRKDLPRVLDASKTSG